MQVRVYKICNLLQAYGRQSLPSYKIPNSVAKSKGYSFCSGMQLQAEPAMIASRGRAPA